MLVWFVFFFKQKTAYEMRISDWSSDVCSSDLSAAVAFRNASSVMVVRIFPRPALAGAAEAASFAPSPAKAGEGWGGVPLGSSRTVNTPSQPPHAVAGAGAKARARG